MNKQSKQRSPGRIWAAAAAALTLIIVFFAATPQGRVLAQDIIRFFAPQPENALVVNTDPAPLVAAEPVVQSPAVSADPADCMSSPFPKCSVSEAQKHVSFTIAYPSELPDDFKLEGVKVLGDGVLIAWSAPKGGYYLYETPFKPGGLSVSPVGNAADVQVTTVNGAHAEFVEGMWYGAATEEGAIPWDNNDAVRTLIWEDEKVEYKLVSSGGKVYESARPSMEQMAAFAATLSANVQPVEVAESGVSLAEAEKQAGFTLKMPQTIPPGFVMGKATYNPAEQMICQHYSDPKGVHDFFMIIAQSPLGLWDPYALVNDPVVGGPNGEKIPIVLDVKHVDMPGALNGKGIYFTNGVKASLLCGGDEFANQGFMWNQDGRSYYLFGNFDGSLGYPFATETDLKRMAQEISGIKLVADGAIDPMRIQSLKDAEALWGGKVYFPSKMLPGYNFDHISFFGNDSGDKWMVTLFNKSAVMEFASLAQAVDGHKTLKLWDDVNEKVTIWSDVPALYKQVCWEGAYPGCETYLIWIYDDTRIELTVRSLLPLPKEQMLEIAGSMKP